MTIQVGEFVHAIFSAIAVAIVVTYFVLSGYRRAVARTMRTESGEPAAAATASSIALQPRTRASQPVAGNRSARATRRRVVLVYACGFAATAAVLVSPLAWRVFAGTEAMSWVGLMVYFLSLLGPGVVLLCALLATSRRATLGVLAASVLAAMAISVVLPALVRLVSGRWSFEDLPGNALQTAALFAVVTLPPLVLVYVTGRRRVRNVVPVTLLAVMLLSLTLMLFNHWQMSEVQDLSRTHPLLMWLVTTIGVFTGPALLFLALSVPVGLLAWWLLRRLQRRYEAHKFSNVQMMIHAWWAIVVPFEAFSIASDLGVLGAIIVGALAYAAFAIVVRLGLRLSRLDARSVGRMMLLLRVFGFQKRTEDLFDHLAERWRFEGPVAMIAGVDLALRSVDIDEALAYLEGNIESRYVASPSDLEHRLQRMDDHADPDGRFRAEEFFCFDNTWKLTLQALVGRADVVLMDLRGLTQANAGCVYELQQLATFGALPRCVFVVDATTDRSLAERSLGVEPGAGPQPAWISMPRQTKGLPQVWSELMRRAAAPAAA